MMTEKQIEFFELLQKMQQKNHDLLPYLQGENLFRGYLAPTQTNWFEDLEREWSEETSIISKQFSVSGRAALLLGIYHLSLSEIRKV